HVGRVTVSRGEHETAMRLTVPCDEHAPRKRRATGRGGRQIDPFHHRRRETLDAAIALDFDESLRVPVRPVQRVLNALVLQGGLLAKRAGEELGLGLLYRVA